MMARQVFGGQKSAPAVESPDLDLVAEQAWRCWYQTAAISNAKHLHVSCACKILYMSTAEAEVEKPVSRYEKALVNNSAIH